MNNYVLDTDIVSLAQRQHAAVLANITSPLQQGHTVGLAVVTVEEQCDGWVTAQRRATRPADVARASASLATAVAFWGPYPTYPQTVGSLAIFRLIASLNVGREDVRIASIALERGAVVVPRNLQHFNRVPGLVTEDWSV